ncbi:MAG: type II/IV secretion system protein [bacterium]|nr:type II/IV secretion system protein [bacterium]
MSRDLGDLLLASGALDEARLREARSMERSGLTLQEALTRLGAVDEGTLYRALAKQHGIPFVDLDKGRIVQEILDRVPAEIVHEQELLPLMERGGKLVVAVDDPLKSIVADSLGFMLGGEVACALSTPKSLRSAISKYYGDRLVVQGEMASTEGDGDEESDAPVVRLVTRMFSDALEERASDIHIEPGNGLVRIRFRIDGLLRDIAEHPAHLSAPLLSRLKIMANLDIAEKRKPQDGRIGIKIGGRDLDVRVSVLPTGHGETIVMRILDRSANLIALGDLGFDEADQKWFRKILDRPNGVVLVTGPTGSGKTTTLYAALQELNRPDVKIITAEDPVEYRIQGMNQVQVNTKVGLTFPRILKAMLRCAPNVILVGEVRDLETAETAIQASLTGHLVFTTLHTNDATSALTRLMDLGIKPFLVSAAVQGVLAQRLVRRLCPQCAAQYTPESEELVALGLDPERHSDVHFHRPRGCRACEGTGYRGRVALYERLELDADLREQCFRRVPLEELKRNALKAGALSPLIKDGARKVLAGTTSVPEVLRVSRSAQESPEATDA